MTSKIVLTSIFQIYFFNVVEVLNLVDGEASQASVYTSKNSNSTGTIESVIVLDTEENCYVQLSFS